MTGDPAPQNPTTSAPRRAIADPRMLEFLVCPLTRAPLQYDAARQELISKPARLAYPIRDGIAVMVADEARHLDDPLMSR